jgi:PAS domain S-box-containing protein
MERIPFSTVDKDETLMNIHEAILESAGHAIISLSPEGIITTFNKASEQLLGFASIDVVGKLTADPFIRPGDINDELRKLHPSLADHANPFRTLLGAIKESSQRFRFDTRLVHKNGTLIAVTLTLAGLQDAGSLYGFVITAVEVPEPNASYQQQREIQSHLQAIITSVDDIVFELDDQGRFTRIWVKSDDYLFLPRERILGRTLAEMFSKEFSQPFDEGVQSVLQTGETFLWEYPSPNPDDKRWFCAKCSMIFEDGKPTRRISVCIQNITDRKLIELSLRQSEEKFRSLAESIPGVVFMMSSDATHLLYANNKISDVTGYAVEDFYNGRADLISLVHEDDRLYVLGVRNKAFEEKVSYQLEYRFQHKSGVWRWLSETGICVNADHQQILEGFIADITNRKESQDELRRMADENSRIFNNSITLSAIAGFDGFFKKLNPAWEKTLGWTREELLAKPYLSFLHPEDVKKTEETLRIIMTGHTVTMFENRFRCKDGAYRWLLWGSSPDIVRKVIYASAIDITSRKKFEEELLISKRNLEVAAYELEEQNRQLDEFAHIISHNLRAPVANIKALLNFISESSQLSEYQLICEKIRNVTHNISETMNELMEMIKIRKTHDIERVEIRFKDVLDKVVQSLEGELIESGATVTYNFNNAPKIYYSKPYLESILQNLISNAIKYRSPDRIPEIYVSTDIIISGIELRVQDNGLGIDLDQHGSKLFGLHKTFHENSEARGVGLFLTKTQIETLGGNIWAESKVNEGTTFVIHF